MPHYDIRYVDRMTGAQRTVATDRAERIFDLWILADPRSKLSLWSKNRQLAEIEEWGSNFWRIS